MLSEGKVGTRALSDGAQAELRMDRTGATLQSRLDDTEPENEDIELLLLAA